jgi:hypothetical protein
MEIQQKGIHGNGERTRCFPLTPLSPQFVANKGFHDIKQQNKQPPPVPSHQAKVH